MHLAFGPVLTSKTIVPTAAFRYVSRPSVSNRQQDLHPLSEALDQITN